MVIFVAGLCYRHTLKKFCRDNYIGQTPCFLFSSLFLSRFGRFSFLSLANGRWIWMSVLDEANRAIVSGKHRLGTRGICIIVHFLQWIICGRTIDLRRRDQAALPARLVWWVVSVLPGRRRTRRMTGCSGSRIKRLTSSCSVISSFIGPLIGSCS